MAKKALIALSAFVSGMMVVLTLIKIASGGYPFGEYPA
jgi:hypothetical protein